MISNIKDNVKKAVAMYQTYGLEVLFEETWRYLTRNSDLMKYTLGTELHEKIVVFPQLRYWPQLDDPRTFNEKILHRKLHTDNKTYTQVSDKYSVRDFVKDRGHGDILNKTHLVTDHASQIRLESLPESFVMKATHGGGSNFVELVEDKSSICEERLQTTASSWLSETFGTIEKEYWYEDIDPRIIIEEFVRPKEGLVPTDYKFFVFDGSVELIEVDQDRFNKHSRVLYDPDWEILNVKYGYPKGSGVNEPYELDKMIDIAEDLGSGFGFARIDLYNPRPNDVRFGEITLAPESGEKRFEPESYDYKLGQCWE